MNHVHKRMGKALLTLVTKKMHLGGTGFGRLTRGQSTAVPKLLSRGRDEQHR